MTKPYGGLVVVKRALKEYHTLELTLMSDLHIGSSQVDYDLIYRNLDAANERGSRILINGDLFDNIVPADRKYRPSKLHPRLAGKDEVTNEVIDWAYEILAPYSERLDLVAVGNHDQWAVDKQGLDMIRELVRRLNQIEGTNVSYGGWTGVVQYRLNGGPLVINYHHGAGKAKPVGSVLNDMTRSVTVGNADIVWQGHVHGKGSSVERVTRMEGARLVERDKAYVVTGSYQTAYRGYTDKAAFKGRRSNFAADNNFRPGGLGSTTVTAWYDEGLRLEVRQ